MVRSGDIGEEGRRRVFEAVGFSFINRLLATRKTTVYVTKSQTRYSVTCVLLTLLLLHVCSTGQLPEGCSVNTYRKIAVTMLACFCTDPELVGTSIA